MIRQLPTSLIPPAEYIQAHPELRPHIWKGPDVFFRLDGPDWLRGIAGIVVYQCTTDPTDIRVTPRALRLSHIPGYFTPPEKYFDRAAGPQAEGGREYKVIDWVELDPKYTEDDRLDSWTAALFTLRTAFALKWKDKDELCDVYWDTKPWNADPWVTWPATSSPRRSSAAGTPAPQTQEPAPPSPTPAAPEPHAAASSPDASAPPGSPSSPPDPSRPPEAASGPGPESSASG